METMIDNDKVVTELQRIIANRGYELSVADSDEFHFDYDRLCATEPLSWKVANFKTFYEYPFNTAEEVEKFIALAKENVESLKEKGILNPSWNIMWRKIIVQGYERIPFDHYLNKRVSQIRTLKGKEPENNPVFYLATTLDINPSQIRYIYIKLLLEGKINIWDLKDLCIAKNSDIDLYKMISQWAETEKQ